MVDLGPVGPCDADGRSVVEVDTDMTEADVAWVNAQLEMAGLGPARPVVSIQPDPNLAQRIQG